MPVKPKQPCTYPGCTQLTEAGYCDEHRKREEKKRHQYYDRNVRDRKLASFYRSKQWALVRQQALTRDHWLCQHCLKEKRITPADMVDHIVPIRVDWSLKLVLGNLQSLCNRCHAVKTVEDKKKYGK